jgi:hypothetical protein
MNARQFKSDENHAQEIIQTHYDGQAASGYIQFCNCNNGRTEDLMDTTTHAMLYDWDETGTHVKGLEILNFPSGAFMRGSLGSDLALTKLSENQKSAVLNKFIKN